MEPGRMANHPTSRTDPPPVIVWFRDDLRLSDHPALRAGADSGSPVICV
jgi:deoxyribodipyrimidine photo-lyase